MAHSYKRFLLIALAFAAVALLSVFNPEETVWLPKCPVHLLTGYQCPGCGFQRAMYWLLHGQVIKAISCNIFLFLAAPYLVALFVVTVCKDRFQRLRDFCQHPYTVYFCLFSSVAWCVLRNCIGI